MSGTALVCKSCEKEFFVKRGPGYHAKFCSLPCRSRGEKCEKNCMACGKGFFDFKNRNRKYCSRECRSGDVRLLCKICGSSFTSVKSKLTGKPGCNRRFCSRKCYLIGRAEEYQVKVKDRICANDDCQRTDVRARGLCGVCYQQWRDRFGPSVTWEDKTCPTCGDVFPTSKDRKFCSFKCYVGSTFFREVREKQKKKAEQARIKRECLNCGKTMSLTSSEAHGVKNRAKGRLQKKRYCSKLCSREYFANRFDRFIMSSSKLEVPASYDEFLVQETLPCLIDGCEWEGHSLSTHMNYEHGITADQFKALAGFNRKTGVISRSLSKTLSKSNSGREFLLLSGNQGTHDRSRKRGPMRAEGREHKYKSLIMKIGAKSMEVKVCLHCEAQYHPKEMAHNQKFCSKGCSDKAREVRLKALLVCSHCKMEFMGSRSQVSKVKKGFPVVCSMKCRDKQRWRNETPSLLMQR